MDGVTLLSAIPIKSGIKFLAPVRETVTAVYEIDFNPDIAHLIHDHWLTFPPQPYLYHLILAVVIAVLGVIAIFGNSAVIYIFSQTRGLRNPSNALIVNLAISDLSLMAVMCPMYVATSLSGKWVFGGFACQFYGFAGALFGTASLLTITAISVDRYLVIWLADATLVLEGFLTTCSFDYLDQSFENRVFILAMCIGAYFAPLFIIVLSYLLIIWEVRSHAKKFAKAATKLKAGENRANEEQNKQKKEIKTAKIAAMIVVCWTLAWTPFTIVSMLGSCGGVRFLTPWASQLPALFAKTASVYNPIIYAISHPKYRAALRKKFPFLICISDEEDEESKRGASSTGAGGTRARKQAVSADVESRDSEVMEFTETTAQPVSVVGKGERIMRSGQSAGPHQSPIAVKATYSKAKEQELELSVRRSVAEVAGETIGIQHIFTDRDVLKGHSPTTSTKESKTIEDVQLDNLSLYGKVTTL